MDFEGFDKLVHVALFGIEAWLLMLATERRYFTTLIIIGWCIILGGALEWLQLQYVVGRDGDVFDLIADALGAIVAVCLFCGLQTKR